MDKIIISKSKMNIFSFILLLIIALLSIIYQHLHFNSFLLQASPMLIVSPFALYLIHDALHIAGFLLFARLKVEQLKITPIKSNMMPYTLTTIPIKPSTYAYILLFPTIILSGVILLSVLLTPNIIFSVLLGIAVGMGGADLLLTIELFKLDKSSKVIPVEEEWGVFVLDTTSHKI